MNRATKLTNGAKWATARREYWLQSHYGIGTKDYESMLVAQGGKCKICGSTDPKRKGQVHFSVDHCHKTGKVRGLLCVTCNTLVGLLESAGPAKAVAFNALVYVGVHEDGVRSDQRSAQWGERALHDAGEVV